ERTDREQENIESFEAAGDEAAVQAACYITMRILRSLPPALGDSTIDNHLGAQATVSQFSSCSLLRPWSQWGVTARAGATTGAAMATAMMAATAAMVAGTMATTATAV
ncbi:unnamed protein product, partial [Phaeothamnion confervicola]